MKLLFITPFFYPHSGGAERYAEELFAHIITKYPDITVDILCYNTNNASSYEEYKRMRIYRVGAFDVVKQQFYLPNPFSLIPLLWRLSKHKYDLVGTQTRFFDATWWTWIYAKLIRAKSLFIGHGTGFVSHHLGYVRFFAKLIDLTIARIALRFYDYHVVISKSTQDFFEKVLGIKHTILIYGGLETALFDRGDGERNEDAVVITYIGRLIEAKGIWVLYEAMKKVIADYPTNNIMFNIGGTGPLWAELADKIANDGLQDKVVMLGELTYPQVAETLKGTDVFVNPSFNEGLPRTVLEAAAAGCIVIATDVGSTREIIIDQQTGFLIPPHDVESLSTKLLEIIENTEQYAGLATSAQEHVREHFDWEVIIENLYDQVFTTV